MNHINWYQRIEIEPGVFTPGIFHYGPDGSDYATTRFGMPKDLTGKTVLDIGSNDGYFSFEAEKRGASKVTAIDKFQAEGSNPNGFWYAWTKLRSQVGYLQEDFMSLSPHFIQHDLVLFYGVLYHLTNPLEGLMHVRNLTKPGGTALIETAILAQSQLKHDPNDSILGYFPNFLGDTTNYFYPTLKCLENMLIQAGFTTIEVIYNQDNRVTVKAT